MQTSESSAATIEVIRDFAETSRQSLERQLGLLVMMRGYGKLFDAAETDAIEAQIASTARSNAAFLDSLYQASGTKLSITDCHGRTGRIVQFLGFDPEVNLYRVTVDCDHPDRQTETWPLPRDAELR